MFLRFTERCTDERARPRRDERTEHGTGADIGTMPARHPWSSPLFSPSILDLGAR